MDLASTWALQNLDMLVRGFLLKGGCGITPGALPEVVKARISSCFLTERYE